MFDKKAMGIQQVFVFIVAALVFAFILIFGYNAITDFVAQGEQVEYFQFKTELESSIKRVYPEFGAVRQVQYLLPAKYEQICFVDLDAVPNDKLCSEDQIACDVWQSAWEVDELEGQGLETGYLASDENVFLSPIGETSIKVFDIEILNPDGSANNDGYLCLKIERGRFSLRLEGGGSHTKISEVLKEN